MNLIIDVGNTYMKLAVFLNKDLVHKERVQVSDFLFGLARLQEHYPNINNAILSSVGNMSLEDWSELNNRFNVLKLDANTKIPFDNKYATPKTLGVDRIALVAAAVEQYPKTNVLIIDAGTCVTYDFIDASNCYLGGGIAPGLQMRYKALNNFTANLPLLELKQPEEYIGDSTRSSMHSGVVNGMIHEIDGFINQYLEEYQDLTVILTGGDAKFLSKQLKSSIFANPNFLLQGLNYILQFNLN